MSRYALAATATFGMESVVSSELSSLGYENLVVENGRVLFEGGDEDIARCNLWLRSADRLLVRLAEFAAGTKDDVYEGVRGIPWADFMPGNPRVVVTARSVRSRLTSVPAVQSVGKKAIVDALTSGRRSGNIDETGPLYSVEIAISHDRASVTLDTSGSGLHKRGYRMEAGEAPLRENLAAGMVLLSRWDSSRPFADPLCGSATIAIEAALIGMNAAPGASRSFIAEKWPHIRSEAWSGAREHAASALRRDVKLDIRASDRDGRVLEAARRNAERAGVSAAVSLRRTALEDLRLEGEYGCIVTNPPYAERLGARREVEGLYRSLGRMFTRLETWSFFALCAHPDFARLFGSKASRNRKLYNGNIRCYFHQYFGPLPDRVRESARHD